MFAARGYVKDSILRWLLADFNFPSEAAQGVTSLCTCFELMLRHGTTGRGPKLYELIESYKNWSVEQKSMAHWVRDTRNGILHAGEFPPEDRQAVQECVKSAFTLARILWLDHGYSLLDHFSPFEVALLEDRVPTWQEYSDATSWAGVFYAYQAPEIAVDVANAAFDRAVRGFAADWRQEGSDVLDMRALIDLMDEHEEEFAHASLYDDLTDFENSAKEFRGERAEWFDPPQDLHAIQAASGGKWDTRRAALLYCNEIRDVVISYPSRVPNFLFADQLRQAWPAIVREMVRVAPDVEFPAIELERWGSWRMYGGEILLPVPFDVAFPGIARPSDYWEAGQLGFLERLIRELCPATPKTIRL